MNVVLLLMASKMNIEKGSLYKFSRVIKALTCMKVYHCSPTSVPCFFRPRPEVWAVNREGLKGVRSKQEHSPASTNSAIALPQAGAHAMPLARGLVTCTLAENFQTYQQLCPALMKAPSHPSSSPMYGKASGGHGRIHACCFIRPMFSYVEAMSRNDLMAASTLSMFGGQSPRNADCFNSFVDI